MEFQIIKGTEQYLRECEMALINSELGRQYFANEGSAKAAVKEGIEAGTLYVALKENEFMGFLYYIPNGAFHSFPYLHLIVTKQSSRGSGVGTAMLKALETLTDKNKIFLCVADFNPDAKRFYERNGYLKVGQMESLYRVGITENLMMKML